MAKYAKTAPKPKSRGIPNAAKPLPTPPTPAPAPPPAPAKVDPFFTPEDLAAINAFTTDWATKMSDIDFGITSLTTDTNFQKGQNDQNAKVNTNEAGDVMAARGMFSSSVKDAAIYDIEAHRSLANKFLDDKLTEATINAGTSRTILADSKTGFDTAMVGKQTANAQGVNDNSLAAWAEKMAAWVPPPVASTAKPPGAAPAKPAAPAKVGSAGGYKPSAGKKLIGTQKPRKTTSGLPNPKPRKP